MARSPGAEPLDQVRDALVRLTAIDGKAASSRQAGPESVDLLLQAANASYVVEWKASGDAANVGGAVRQLLRLKAVKGRSSKRVVVPVVAVPFMGETGRRICAESGVSWLDLSGNAWIDAPGHHIRVLGNRNRFAVAGRPANVFAPKSSRVVRALLMEPERSFSQAGLALVSGVDKGRVSRLVPRLEALGLVQRSAGRGIRLKDPAIALEAWREAYDFEQHAVRRGHVSVRSPDELIDVLHGAGAEMRWALTGLAAAWQLTRFAMFRLTTVFLRESPQEAWLRSIGFRDEARGANLWLVRPVDDAVFEGSSMVEGVPCAHPLQVYLDLKAHPERAPEAAEELKKRFLRWRVE